MEQSGCQSGAGGWAEEGSTGQGGREFGLWSLCGVGPHLPLLPWLCGPRQVSEPLWAQLPVGKRDTIKPHMHCGMVPSHDVACPSVPRLKSPHTPHTQIGKPYLSI